MAEILFKAQDASHVDPEKDLKSCFKSGDPIVVQPDGWAWGKEELKPPSQGGFFFLIKIPGRTVEQVQSFLTPAKDGNGNVIRRRLWRLVLSDLPNNIQNQLINEGSYTANWSSVRNFIENKISKAKAGSA